MIENNTKLIIFDITGVLTTDGHLVSSLLKSILPEKDRDLLKINFKMYELGQIPNDKFWRNIEVGNSDEIEHKLMDKIILREGMEQVLAELKKKYQLAILSNMPKEWADTLSNKFHFKEYFETTIYSADYGTKKPDKELYEILLKKYPNIKPEEMTFVDDKLENLETAKQLGIQTILLKIEEDNFSYIPDIIIRNIEELKDI